MKYLILITLFIGSFINSQAQDLIVTISGDSINCKITKVKDQLIYFTYIENDLVNNTLISVDEVQTYQFDKTEATPGLEKVAINNRRYSHWHLAISGGWGYQTAKVSDQIPSDFQDYAHELKSGYQFSGDLAYYITQYYGIGMKYLSFNSSNQMSNIYVTYPDGSTKTGEMSDDIKIRLIGPYFGMRLPQAYKMKRNTLYMNMGLGYVNYKDNAQVIDKIKLTSETMGLIIDLGYDIDLSPNAAIGFQISYLMGSLTKYDKTVNGYTETIELKDDDIESISRLDLSIGLRFNTKN